ncbi:MAG: hypothetical protein ACXIUZ_02625 [Lysobacteraceae bacterium]
MHGQHPPRTALPAAFALCALLAACGSGDNLPATAQADPCTGNALARVLPEGDHVASKPLQWRQCDSEQTVSACYASQAPCNRAPDSCEITLHDSAFALGRNDGPGSVGEVHAQAQSLILGMNRFTVEGGVSSHDNLLSMPELLAIRGGPPHLPVVDTLPTGDTYVVLVPAINQSDRQADLVAVIDDRFSLSISCREDIRDNEHARRMYGPYLNAMHFGRLPGRD